MTTRHRRRSGRAVRRARRAGISNEGTLVVTLAFDACTFERALHHVTGILRRLARPEPRLPQLLHNGRKPR